jgi:hypothetical protein
MGASDSKLDLSEYDVSKLGDIGKFLFMGPHIDSALAQFLYLKRHLPQVVVMTPPRWEEAYRQIVPDIFIHTTYSSKLTNNVIKRQLKKGDSMGPILVVVEHDPKELPVDRLYRQDMNFRQLFDYTERLRLCLVIVCRDTRPINIALKAPVRMKQYNDDDVEQEEPCFDSIFVSTSRSNPSADEEEGGADDGEQEDSKYLSKLYKYYFRRCLPDDKETFEDTLSYYTSKKHVLLLQRAQEMFYYLPQEPTEPFVIAADLVKEI